MGQPNWCLELDISEELLIFPLSCQLIMWTNNWAFSNSNCLHCLAWWFLQFYKKDVCRIDKWSGVPAQGNKKHAFSLENEHEKRSSRVLSIVAGEPWTKTPKYINRHIHTHIYMEREKYEVCICMRGAAGIKDVVLFSVREKAWREDGKPGDDIEPPFHSSYGSGGRHVGYKMKFPLAYPHEIEVQGAGEDDSPIHTHIHSQRTRRQKGWMETNL